MLSLFGDGDAAPGNADLDRWADAGGCVFLAAYAPPDHRPPPG